MKRLKLKLLLSISSFVILSLNLSSQTVTFDNHLTCPVQIAYRSTDASCNNCGAGTLTIPSSSIILVTFCGSLADLEVTILTISSTPITTNNTLVDTGLCYLFSSNSISGSNPSGCSTLSTGWAAFLYVITAPGFGFLIQ